MGFFSNYLVDVAAKDIIPQTGWSIKGKVTDVHDGDTVTVSFSKMMKVRLIDCWAPEVTGIQKAIGLQARDNMKNLVLDKEVTVFIPEDQSDIGKSTSISRFLGHIWVGDTNIAAKQVSDGFACKTKKESELKFGPYKATK